ncbi:hypothetical protein B0H12DRAFT_1068156 [Mycena haematopus]|nr:hypothetical protein B0H12DRAFT_1068156 [Mycena haematopus]
MQPSQAELYQTTVDQFYARNALGSVDQSVNPPVVLRPRANGGRAAPFDHRVFAPGAGEASAPIDVDEWDALAAIDVDASSEPAIEASGGSVAKATVHERRISTLCMHVFCDACISHSLAYSTSCPLCRSAIVDPPLRDHLFEEELEAAIDGGIVQMSGAVGRRKPYTWRM